MPNSEECKGATFSGCKQNLYSFLFTLPKVAPLHHGFLYLFFRHKITEIDRAVKWLDWNLTRHNFSNLGTFPCTPPNNTVIEKNKIIILCSVRFQFSFVPVELLTRQLRGRVCMLPGVQHHPRKNHSMHLKPDESFVSSLHLRRREHDRLTRGKPRNNNGPSIKLPKSRSVENFATIDVQAPPPDPTGNFEDEVDFGGSEPPSPHPTEREEEQSSNSSPTAQSCSSSTAKRSTSIWTSQPTSRV